MTDFWAKQPGDAEKSSSLRLQTLKVKHRYFHHIVAMDGGKVFKIVITAINAVKPVLPLFAVQPISFNGFWENNGFCGRSNMMQLPRCSLLLPLSFCNHFPPHTFNFFQQPTFHLKPFVVFRHFGIWMSCYVILCKKRGKCPPVLALSHLICVMRHLACQGFVTMLNNSLSEDILLPKSQ